MQSIVEKNGEVHTVTAFIEIQLAKVLKRWRTLKAEKHFNFFLRNICIFNIEIYLKSLLLKE